MRVLGWLVAAAYFVLVLWFALNNSIAVPLRLTRTLVWPDVPLVVVILLCFVAGVLAGVLAMVPKVLRQGRKQHRAGRKRAAVGPGDLPPERRADRLADAARNAGAAGDLDVHTQTPARKIKAW